MAIGRRVEVTRREEIRVNTDVDSYMTGDEDAVFTAIRQVLGCVEEKFCFPAVLMTGTSLKKIPFCCIQVCRKCQLHLHNFFNIYAIFIQLL